MRKLEPKATLVTVSPQSLERNRKFGMVTPGGVVYDEELAGASGMRFTLYREEGTTTEMLEQAVRDLRQARDVFGPILVSDVGGSEPPAPRPRSKP